MGKSIRSILFSIVTIGIHFWIIFEVFIRQNIIHSIIGILLFFVFFHFVFLDLYKKPFANIVLAMTSLTLLEVLRLNTFSRGMMVVGLIIVNMSCIYLAYSLKENADKSVEWSTPSYFWNSGYLFTLGITIAYSLFTIGIYNNFPFSCKDLDTNSNKVIEFISKPFYSLLPNQTNPSNILNETKVKDLLAVGKMLNIESDVKGVAALDQFKTRKNDIITKTIDENKELNQGICEYSLNKLQTKLKNPEFQIGAMVLMIAITYPFLRVATQIVSLIAMLGFEVLKLCKIYNIQKIQTEVEKIG